MEEIFEDGITVNINSDEFPDVDNEGEREEQAPQSSDDEVVVDLGESAASTSARQKVGKKKGAGKQPANAEEDVVNLSSDEHRLLEENPHMQSIMSKMLDAKLKKFIFEKLSGKQDVIDKASSKPQGEEIIKSPSDTTIYAPALRKQGHVSNDDNVQKRISDFVGAIRQESSGHLDGAVAGPSGVNVASARTRGHNDGSSQRDETKIQAERNKVAINTPPGNVVHNSGFGANIGNAQVVHYNPNNRMQIQSPVQQVCLPVISESGLSDDDFFHLTCHLETNLIQKIENGEFVELEKLLPKDRMSFGRGGGGQENRLEWVQRDGSTYLVAVGSRDTRISGIRRWEQAFRVYTTIYCAANP